MSKGLAVRGLFFFLAAFEPDRFMTTSPTVPTPETENPFRYTGAMAKAIEPAWQKQWAEREAFRTPNPGDAGFDASKPKFYCLDMFPYPSGAGLHVGHPEGYTATDILCRYMRMTGHNVLHPMGWDAFGLPAEQYAVQTNVHPAITTRKAIETFKRQLQRFGFSYDWSREIATIDPDYYRWTQWIWLQAYSAWYDPRVNAARPISELIAALESGRVGIDMADNLVFEGPSLEAIFGSTIGVRKWHELDPQERIDVIDSHRLAYLGEQTVNWCAKLGTVLANEEVIDGRSERGGYPVTRMPLKQWMFRITAYAERLLADLSLVKWPESTRIQQTEWIGRSEGAEIEFEVEGGESLTVFTTRPDTIFGATYMVVAPEHPLVDEVLAEPDGRGASSLRAYVEAARNKADVDRMADSKEKTGVFTGLHAINPASGKRIPVWTADYVLVGYGHGAIMAVPGHDERDHAFARKFDLPIVAVVSGNENVQEKPFTGDGESINSANDEVSLNGLPTEQAKQRIIEWIQSKKLGARKVNYKLRDWLFSRQRYWGEPFPVVFDARGNHFPIQESKLPVRLPELADFKPIEAATPTPPLGKATAWVTTTAGEAGVSSDLLPPSTPVTRETNTMPNWAGSCWYYLRYCDPKNADRFIGRDAERYWMVSAKSGGGTHAGGVDLYVGGSEHAVLHLLYARFWHKVLFDLGHVSTPEPFGRLFHQGLISSFAYQRTDKTLVPVDEVKETSEGVFVEIATDQPVTQITAKMSKSLKNVVNPDDVIAEYGADTFRLYEMYMGPLDAGKPWNPRDINGLYRFLQRVWRLAVDEQAGTLRLTATADPEIEKKLHRTIHKVGADVERLAFNTAIAAMIEFTNAASGVGLTRSQLERFVLMLAPFAPHVGEELWSRLGHSDFASHQKWPAVDKSQLKDDQIELPIQMMGKVKARIMVPADADAAAIESIALSDEKVKVLIEGKTVKKVVVVPGKMVNIVTN
jgi:leucyl-tRNA synthetase